MLLYDVDLAGSTEICNVSAAGDVDADGVPDVVYTSYFGRVEVRSGRTDALLHRFDGSFVDRFGTAAAGIGDVDGDGCDDIVVTATSPQPSQAAPSYLRVYSGRTGAMLRHIPMPQTIPTVVFGNSVQGVGDLDGDGVRDFVASGWAQVFVQDSPVAAFSGATGAVLWQQSELGQPGAAILDLGDMDGDGVTDLALGNLFGQSASTPGGGVVRLRSGATGSLIASWPGLSNGDWFGASLALVGDLDGDGLRDVAVGAPHPDWDGFTLGPANGQIEVRSTATGAVLLFITEPVDVPIWCLGSQLVVVNDQDSDGQPDLLTFGIESDGAWGIQLRLYSTSTGAFLGSPLRIDEWGQLALASMGDINGDGATDVAVRTTRYRLLMVDAPAPTRYCVAKSNSLGCVPEISSSGAPSLSVGDNFTLRATSVLNQEWGVLLWGASALSLPFQGGRLCVSPGTPQIRGPLLDSGGSPGHATDCSGSYTFHFGHALMQSRALPAGTPIYAQFLSRDPGFAPPRNIGLSDALAFTVVP